MCELNDGVKTKNIVWVLCNGTCYYRRLSTMSKLGGASDFVREYTLASGGPYCDCGYKKKA